MKMRKRLSVVAAVLMAFGPTTLPSLAHAGDRAEGHRHRGPRTIQVKERFAGSGISNVVLAQADGTPEGQAILGRDQARGRFGSSVSRSLLRWDPLAWSYSPECFEGGPGLVFPVVQLDFVKTYSELSTIHGVLVEGELCVNFEDYSQTLFRVDMSILGGTGRFAGATGVVRSEGKSESLPPGRLSFSTGVSRSTLTLP